jgi:BON domain
MAYDEEQARRSRVVVETPNERREVVHTQSVRDNSGISAGMVGVLVVVAIALITMLVLFWMSSQPATDNANMAAQQPTTVVQQPAPVQQPPVIIQQPAPATTQPAPIIVTPPAGGTSGGTTATDNMNMDSTVQAAVDKKLSDDPAISQLGITASVVNGKVMLIGTVKTDALKTQIERMVKQVKGVKEVDNQISVIAE